MPESSNLTPSSAAKGLAKFTAKSVGQGATWEVSLRLLRWLPQVSGLVAAAWTYLTNDLTKARAIMLGVGVMVGMSLALFLVGAFYRFVWKDKEPTKDDDEKSRTSFEPEERQQLVNKLNEAQSNARHWEGEVGRAQLEATDRIELLNNARIESNARASEIEQRYRVTEERLEELEWLEEISFEQSQTLNRFVGIVDCVIAHHELFRDDPYVDFSLTFWNRSIFDISVVEPVGTISFYQRALTAGLSWKEQTRIIKRGDVGSFTLRQRLTRDDRTYLLNHPAHFNFIFNDLEIRVEGHGSNGSAVKPQPARLEQGPPTNADLLAAYPKLHIEVHGVLATIIVDFRSFEESDGLFTVDLVIRNLRDTPITLESFHLEATLVAASKTVGPESGEIQDRKHITKEGQLTNSHNATHRSPNLNDRIPLTVRDAEVKGSLQFVLPKLGYDLLNHPASYRIVAIDTRGEKHFVVGTAGRPTE